MPEGSDREKKVVPLRKPLPYAERGNESLSLHKRRVSLYIKDLQESIAKNEEDIKSCDEAIDSWARSVQAHESRGKAEVPYINPKKAIGNAQEGLKNWQRQKEYHEERRKVLTDNLEDATRYRRSLEANHPPKKS